MSNPYVVAGVTAGAVLGAAAIAQGALSLDLAHPALAFQGHTGSTTPLARGMRMAFQDMLQRFADGRLFRPESEAPPGVRWVPVVPSRPVDPLDRATRTNSRAMRLACLDLVRQGMRGAGWDADPRCALYRFAEETGWFRYQNHWNVGFTKMPRPYSSRERLLSANPTVGVTAAEATCAFMLIDHAVPPSFDMYYGFDNLAGYMPFKKRWFERNNYPQVMTGWARGGVEGLIEAESNMAHRGYSTNYGRVLASGRLPVIMHGYWATNARVCGDEWVR